MLEEMNKLVRDTRQPLEYWNSVESVFREARSFERGVEMYKELLSRGHGTAVGSLFRNSVKYIFRSINYFYSRGDDLDELRSAVLNEALEASLYIQQEISDGNRISDHNLFFDPFYEGGCRGGELKSVYSILAWCVCMDADVEVVHKLVPLITDPTGDRLMDMVMQQYSPERKIAPGSAMPKVFSSLDQVIDAQPSERPKLLLEYLNNWGKTINKIKGGDIGGANPAARVKSNKDLDTEEVIRSDLRNYEGWWAWEVALLVRVLGIDDSIFADHVLYPVDLARYRNKENPVNLWPLGSESLPAVSTTPHVEVDIIGDLFVAVDLPPGSPSPISLFDLYEFQEGSEAEDFYYAAVDDGECVVSKDPLQLNRLMHRITYTVATSKETSRIKFATEEIRYNTEILTGYYERYLPHRDNVEDEGGEEFLDYFEIGIEKGSTSRRMELPIASGPGWASWIYVGSQRSGSWGSTVRYMRVLNDEVLEIVAINHITDLTLGEFIAHWEMLVKKYSGDSW